MTSMAQEVKALNGKCLIIGHRGAPGFGGENTLFGFKKALDLGADGFELDLIQTKDGKLIIGHDYDLVRLIGESQLETLYPEKKKGKKWIITDFTLEELRSLKVTFPAPGEKRYDYTLLGDDYKMPLLSEALDLILQERRDRDRPDLKIYIEIKTKEKYSHTMTRQDISDQIKKDLSDRSMLKDKNTWIQSFDDEMMDVIAKEKAFASIDKCQLGIDSPAEMLGMKSTKKAETYLDEEILGRGLQMLHIWKVGARLFMEKREIPLVQLAHSRNIPLHLYTFRDPNFQQDYKPFAAMGVKGFESIEEELKYFMEKGVDAVMTDYVTSALQIRDEVYKPKGREK